MSARLHQYTPIKRDQLNLEFTRTELRFPLGDRTCLWFDEPGEVARLIADLTAARDAWEHHRRALTAGSKLGDLIPDSAA
jgi:hypothetical protein